REAEMFRRLALILATLVPIVGVVPSSAGAPRALHDFDPFTLAAYIDFRFSSAVPLPFIRTVLAADRFSARDLALVSSWIRGGAVDTGWSASFDGGRAWRVRGPAPGLTVQVSHASTKGRGAPFARASDPVVAFDRKHHRVFLESIGVADPGCAVFCDSAITIN